MIGPDHFWGSKTIICLWIFFQLYTVSCGRGYDKCVTGDGRQGVCVVKRFCREASHHELLLCEDGENHCCPIPTTQRSAQSFPKMPERPREEGRHREEGIRREEDRRREEERRRVQPNVKDKRPVAIGEHERDDRLNKTPPPEDRRSPTRHGNDRPKKPPTNDKADDDRRRPKPSQGHSQEIPPDRSRDVFQSRPSIRPKEHERRDPPLRRPDSDRFYPAKDDLESSRVTSPPRRVNHDKEPSRVTSPPRRVNHDEEPSRVTTPPRRVSHDPTSSKNRTMEDTSKLPIRFPEPYEFSVPSPKVPACGVKPYELFIAGGQESQENEWPWMTAIFRRFSDSRPKIFLCGGSLINTKYVLTAAHCFVNNYVILPASSFVVRVGSHFLDSGEEYTVANLIIHHNHSGSDFFNDIALVRLASEVYITDKIAPICLPSPDMMMNNFLGRLATVSGWGDTAFRTSGSRILQHVSVPIVSGDECFAAYSRVRGAAFLARGSDHVICAGLREGGKDACLGDSGGPLMIKMPDDRWIIVGIVSLGYKCAEPGYPGVYTRVTHYMSWIDTNMKKY